METIYYTLDTRLVSHLDMASGESAPSCKQYCVLRKGEHNPAGEGGKVLDFASYQKKLASPQVEEELDLAPVPMAKTQPKGEGSAMGFILDGLATLGILAMSAIVIFSFLPFLSSL